MSVWTCVCINCLCECVSVCVCVCTSCHATSGHLPDDESVAVDIGHDVRLELIFVQALVQDLRGHVAPCPNTCAQRDVHFIGVAMTSKESFSCSLTGSFVLKDISSFSQGSNISSYPLSSSHTSFLHLLSNYLHVSAVRSFSGPPASTSILSILPPPSFGHVQRFLTYKHLTCAGPYPRDEPPGLNLCLLSHPQCLSLTQIASAILHISMVLFQHGLLTP